MTDEDEKIITLTKIICDKCGFSYWVSSDKKDNPIPEDFIHKQKDCEKKLIEQIQTE